MNFISFALIILEIVGMYKVFEKLGEDGWKAIIPLVNSFTVLKVGKKNPWAFLLGFAGYFSFIMGMFVFMVAASTDADVSGFVAIFALLFFIASMVLYIVYIVIAFHAYQNICDQLGQSVNYAWLFLFFPYVMWIVAGFDDKWEPDEATIAYLNQQHANKKSKNGARNADAQGNQRPAQPSQPAQSSVNYNHVTVKPVKLVEPINIQPVTVKPAQMSDDHTDVDNSNDKKTPSDN